MEQLMNKKNLLKLLPIVILTATQITIGMDGKPGNKSNTTNNYHAPVNNYYGTVINNQYPMCYGIFPLFWSQNPQCFPTPNIQNNQYNPFQQCCYCYPTFSNNVLQNKNNNNQIQKRTKLNINSKKYIKKIRSDIFLTPINSDGIGQESENETLDIAQLNSVMENDLFFQNIITPIIGKSPKKQEEINYINSQTILHNDVLKSMGLILQNSIAQFFMSINGKIFINKLKELQKQSKIEDGIDIINEYHLRKLNKYNPIIEQLTNDSCKKLQDVFEILNNPKQHITETEKIKKGLLNNLKKNKFKQIEEEINKELISLTKYHNNMKTQQDILEFFEKFLNIKNSIYCIKSTKYKDKLQECFDEFVRKLNNNESFDNPNNRTIVSNIYKLLLNSYKNITLSTVSCNNKIWKLNKYKIILDKDNCNSNYHKEIINNIIDIIVNKYSNYLKNKNIKKVTSKKNNDKYNKLINLDKVTNKQNDDKHNKFINLNNEYIKLLNNNKENNIGKFKTLKENFDNLRDDINKINYNLDNKYYLLENIRKIQKYIDKNIELLKVIYPNYKQEDEKEEFNNIEIQDKYKNLNNINIINNFNNYLERKYYRQQQQEIKIKEIIENYKISLQNDTKIYNNLINELKNDIKNKQINFNKYEQNIKNYFVESINENIKNIFDIIHQLFFKQNIARKTITINETNKYTMFTNIINMCNSIKYFFKYFNVLCNNGIDNENINLIYNKIFTNIYSNFIVANKTTLIEYYFFKMVNKNNDLYKAISALQKWETEDIQEEKKNKYKTNNLTKDKKTIEDNFFNFRKELLNAIENYRTKNINETINEIKENNRTYFYIFSDTYNYEIINKVINFNNAITNNYKGIIDKFLSFSITRLNYFILQLNGLLYYDYKVDNDYVMKATNELLNDLDEYENTVKNLKLVEQKSTTNNK